MSLLRLALSNLWHKPLNALLSIILFALSVGLVSLLANLRLQADEQFDNNLAGVNLVVGAKGSPLELVLNSMYHVGYPNGNVELGEVKAFFNPKHPIVSDAIPLSLGDSYMGYRIVGTTPDLIVWYGGHLGEGRLFQRDLETVVGSELALAHDLAVGSTFKSSHGIIDEGEDRMEHDDEFTVVGILAPGSTVLDQIALTTNATYWHSHESHDSSGEEAEHGDHDHGHDHGEHDHTTVKGLMQEDPSREITSLLVRYRNPTSFQALNFARNINENTELLAANPAYEISEVRRQFDTGQRLLGILVLVITIVSALSIFIALFVSLRERRYELALMRVMGAGRGRLFALIIAEGLIVAVAGYLLGIALSHGLLAVMASQISGEFRYALDPWRFIETEAWLAVGALAIGFIAAALPAAEAARTDVGETLLGEN